MLQKIFRIFSSGGKKIKYFLLTLGFFLEHDVSAVPTVIGVKNGKCGIENFLEYY